VEREEELALKESYPVDDRKYDDSCKLENMVEEGNL